MSGRKKETHCLEEDWSDKLLEEMANSIKFPKEVFDRQAVKSIIARFFYFYLTGNVSPDCSVRCTVYSAISLLNVYNSQGFTRVFEAKHYMSIGDNVPFFNIHQHDSDMPANYFKDFDKEKRSLKDDIGSILAQWDSVNTYSKEKSKLMRLAGFLALKFCTVISRSKPQVIKSFRDDNFHFKSILSEVVGWNSEKHYSSPNSQTIDECFTELTGDDINRYSLKSLFIIVVRHWIQSVKLPRTEKISSLLFDSVLEETSGNGIGLITLMLSVKYSANVTIEQILKALEKEKLSFAKYETSWSNLLEFQSKFLDKKNLQLGYAWARIIDSKYLIKYSAKKNIFFCGIFATIVEIYDGSEVWNAQWVHLDSECLKEAKIVGKRIYERLNNA